MKNRRGIAGIFRVIAGGYLIYLAIKLIRDGILTGEMQGNARVFGILASALFIVAGAFFIIQAFRWMSRMSQQEEEEQNEEAAEAEVQAREEQVQAGPSLFDRAGFGSSLYEEDEEEGMEEDEDWEGSSDEENETQI